MTWATSVPILVFLGLSVLDLGPMYAADVRQHNRIMTSPYGSGGNNNIQPRATNSPAQVSQCMAVLWLLVRLYCMLPVVLVLAWTITSMSELLRFGHAEVGRKHATDSCGQ